MKKSFAFAFKGLASCVRTERNFRIHLVAAFYVLAAAAVMHLTKAEWIAVILCIGAVMGAEIFNTSIEKLCDAVHPDRSVIIGLVKDMTAGGVLMFSAASAVIGGIVFIDADKWLRVLKFIKEQPIPAVLIALTLPAAMFFIFRRYRYDGKNSHDNNSRPAERR
jgi:diacylglycerol kinase (ATP)